MARKLTKTQTTSAAAKATSSTPKRRTTAPLATGVKVPAKGPLKRAVAETAPVVEKAPAAEPAVAAKPAELRPAAAAAVEIEVKPEPIAAAAPVQEAAAQAQAPAFTPDRTASLRHTLRGDDADAARDAADALGAFGDPSAVDVLAEVLWNNSGYYHAVVRAAAATALGQLRHARGVDALVFAVRDPMAEASAEAIRALARIGEAPAAADAIVDVVRNRDNYFLPFVRRVAVEALAQLGGGDRAYDELRAVANTPWEDPAVREAAQAATRDDAL